MNWRYISWFGFKTFRVSLKRFYCPFYAYFESVDRPHWQWCPVKQPTTHRLYSFLVFHQYFTSSFRSSFRSFDFFSSLAPVYHWFFPQFFLIIHLPVLYDMNPHSKWGAPHIRSTEREHFTKIFLLNNKKPQ